MLFISILVKNILQKCKPEFVSAPSNLVMSAVMQRKVIFVPSLGPAHTEQTRHMSEFSGSLSIFYHSGLTIDKEKLKLELMNI